MSCTMSKIESECQKSANLTADFSESDAIFDAIAERGLIEGVDLIKSLKSTYRFNVINKDGNQKSYFVNAKTEPFFVGNRDDKADCTFTVADDILAGIYANELKPHRLFMQGKLKMTGNIAKALNFNDLLNSKKVKAKL